MCLVLASVRLPTLLPCSLFSHAVTIGSQVRTSSLAPVLRRAAGLSPCRSFGCLSSVALVTSCCLSSVALVTSCCLSSVALVTSCCLSSVALATSCCLSSVALVTACCLSSVALVRSRGLTSGQPHRLSTEGAVWLEGMQFDEEPASVRPSELCACVSRSFGTRQEDIHMGLWLLHSRPAATVEVFSPTFFALAAQTARLCPCLGLEVVANVMLMRSTRKRRAFFCS